ncbi:Zn(2+)-responsive transcriptional regulator [Spongiibacter sp.]|uniref:Zn(2+)-responsive transcriptional regulator n=1 Tax=Spongiibacter sp. TaxID=2024860 RepID=UPI003563552F
MTQRRIGELAKQLNCTVETLRFYEREGLLAATGRSANGYRFYNDASVKQLEFILRAKGMGFSLEDIRELLAIRVDPLAKSCGDVRGIAEEKLAQVDRKLRELQSIRDALSKVVDACCGGDVPANHCSILLALDSDLQLNQEAH